MRRSTLFFLVLSAFFGTALFHTSQKVHDEREKLAALNVSIGKEEESLRVLNAEWSYLNQPARLEKLAKTYLDLAPLKASQFVKLEDIAPRPADAPEASVAAAPAPEEKTEEKKAEKPQIAAIETPKPVIKAKDAHHAPVKISKNRVDIRTISWAPPKPRVTSNSGHDNKTATNTRSFNDLMKNLRSGVE